jgi:dienelactone hydrolase
MMKDYMTGIAARQFAARDSLLSTFRSAEDWDRRAKTIRDSLISWTGPFPQRNPLNACINGRLEREGYVVEKILYESRPGFLVSANLYLPEDFPLPRPAVLNVIGHWGGGKFTEHVQSRCIGQARKGFVALAIDCIGQGERRIREYASAPKGVSTHKIIGKQAFISGTHLFNFMVWDAIRAIDYLESRPEVDREKICITGASGGGMMSTYILPFEDRISVAIPTCNPNTWKPIYYGSIGTDSEQNFFGTFRSAIDPRGDPLFAHVPKPLMINATADDGNPPRGVWELSTWLYKSYAAHGVPEKFTASMVRAGHGYNREQREVAYAWMMRWTGTGAGDFTEGDITLETVEDLRATGSGNVFDEPGSRRPQELVVDHLEEYRARWGPVTTENALGEHKTRMVSLIENVLHSDLDPVSVECETEAARYAGDMRIRPFVLKPEAGILLTGIILEAKGKIPGRGADLVSKGNDTGKETVLESKSKGTAKRIILYIHENGKSAILGDMEVVEKLLHDGYSVCAVDLRGTGETGPYREERNWDFHTGKPIFGQRLQDVLSTLKWLKESGMGAQDIKIWGTGMGALYGAYAGALDKDISGFLLVEPLVSYESVVRVTIPTYGTEVLLPGILEQFDMPQVYQSLCPRPVTLLNPLSGDKTPAGKTDIDTIDKPVAATYRALGKKKAWSIEHAGEENKEKIISKALTGK